MNSEIDSKPIVRLKPRPSLADTFRGKTSRSQGAQAELAKTQTNPNLGRCCGQPSRKESATLQFSGVVCISLLWMSACAVTSNSGRSTDIQTSPTAIHADAAVAAESLAPAIGGTKTVPSATLATDDKQILILTPYPDEDAKGFQSTMARFTAQTGITVQVRAVGGDFVDELYDPGIRDKSDMAVFPQPGVFRDLAKSQSIKEIPADIAAQARKNIAPVLAHDGEVDTKTYGLSTRASASLGLIYRTDLFQRNGWKVPTTWEELDSLSEQIKAAGLKPFCFGAAARGATGWALTTLVEAYVTGHSGSDPVGVTDQWIAHKLKASDEPIRSGVDWTRKAIVDWSYPGGAFTLDVPVERGLDPLFLPTPPCAMGPIYDFMSTELPVGWESIAGFFKWPAAIGNSTAGGASSDILGAFNLKPSTVALLRFIASTPDYGIEWTRQGGYLSPYLGIRPDQYSQAIAGAEASTLRTMFSVVPDASDEMPPSAGSGTYWKGLASLASGSSTDDAIKTMESGWTMPASSGVASLSDSSTVSKKPVANKSKAQ